ncbi:gamma-glutamylcyclotransferase family protein [Lamprobacter modestohalophilus]|uniref:gamma-glutamylcyclotransferase family protein n=1 Tax=Lamprobacter modestohalophilus TaxID=1064514 RepID=UPI002ADEC2CA|nr:gamma-glutamylcyclotransferase family protein [Lamprobacter modestohalophilus]MEA1050461.1 gamma-glutamylcyclotransferase family protein [Lamprobacter modestohalophilus]
MLYFAYGANTHRAQMAHRCPGASFLSQAVLRDHELVFRGVADIRTATDKTVTGALWDIDEQDLAALDRFEGYPSLYTRRGVSVLLDRKRHGFDRALAIVYQMSAGRQLSPPADAYLNTLVQGYTDCGLPEEQIGIALSTTFAEHDGALYRSQIWGQHGDRHAH